jgi:starch synthase
MHIVHITSELSPLAKVGGLADVVYGLCKELSHLGDQIEIILPKYDCLDVSPLKNLKVERKDLLCCNALNTVWRGTLDNIKIILIEPHNAFFNRGMIYGCPDDTDRFLYFSRTAIEYLYKTQNKPDLLHLHDWPTAIIPVLIKEIYAPLGFQCKGSVLTIHNLEHQGKCTPSNLSRIGLRGESFLTPEKLQDPYTLNLINLLKGGIVYADQLTTVSPNYKKEILTPEGGCGLHTLLIQCEKKLHGILNGIDKDFWDPTKDFRLAKKYPKTLEGILQAKEENRNHLRTLLRLKKEKKPLVASICRLVRQKSPELIQHALEQTLAKGGQFVLLGSSTSPEILQHFSTLKKKLAKSDQVAILLETDETMAHLIFAAADLFVIPSLFEPCGLTQLIALRYGTIPVVRLTGGLVDTVFDIDTSTRPLQERNGFTFDHPDPAGVDWALDRALQCWKTDREKWKTLITQGMRWDFSWTHTAPQYQALYKLIKS